MVKVRTRVSLDHLIRVEKKTEPETDVVDACQVQVIAEERQAWEPVIEAENESCAACRDPPPQPQPSLVPEPVKNEVSSEEVEMVPEMPFNTHWTKPEILLTEMSQKQLGSRKHEDPDSGFLVMYKQRKMDKVRSRVSLDHLIRVEKKTESEVDVVDACQVQVIAEKYPAWEPVIEAENEICAAYRDPSPQPQPFPVSEPVSNEATSEEFEMVPDIPFNPHLIEPEILLTEMSQKQLGSRKHEDPDSGFLVMYKQRKMDKVRSRVSLDHLIRVEKKTEPEVDVVDPSQVQVIAEERPVAEPVVEAENDSYTAHPNAPLQPQPSPVPEPVVEAENEIFAAHRDHPPQPQLSLVPEPVVEAENEIFAAHRDHPLQPQPFPVPDPVKNEETSEEVVEMVPEAVSNEETSEEVEIMSEPGSNEEMSEEVEIVPEPVRYEEMSEENEMVPDMPFNPHWIKPEILLTEMWQKQQGLRKDEDSDSDFVFPSDDVILNTPVLQIPDLMVLKGKLNETKSRLDHFPLQEWHIHTKQMNIANSVMSSVKRYANPEFSSQAWGKMFEILCCYDVIPADIIREADAIHSEGRSDKVPFDTIHLCEAPGAFVSALNHFVKISYPAIDWNWMATTLNPYHESNDTGRMINDDRLIIMSMDHWTFLEDYTGNILTYHNLKHIVKERQWKLLEPRKEKTGKDHESVGLVTADGSIDCQTNPSDQEKMVAPLQYGEIVTALMLLHKGGTFILKIFTFLEAATICHLYLLSCVFKQVHLFKPTTSKEGNSEVYVICLGYLGKDSIRQILHKKLVPAIESYKDLLDRGKTLFPLQSIPPFFMKRLHEAAYFFCNYQIDIIMRNISCFPCDTRVYEIMMKPAQKLAAKQWIEMASVEPLPAKDRLFNDERMRKAVHVDARGEHGCFADKVHRIKGDHFTKLAYIKADLLALQVWKTPQNHTLFGGKFLIGNVRFERSYKNIHCSRFCHGRLLSDREEVRNISNNYLRDMEMNGLKSMENICMGHTLKRLYKSMAKSCDVMLRDLEVLCFMKMTYNFVSKSDFEAQRNDLKRLVEGVKDLEKGRSMFLCRFPMLSRLQTGIIYCLTAVFDKVIIYADPEKNVIGIMLHQFKGLCQPENKKLFHSIDDIIGAIEEDEFDRPVLEMVPMKTLLNFYPAEFLLNYNTLLTTQDMLRTISVVEGIMLKTRRPVPDQLSSLSFLTA